MSEADGSEDVNDFLLRIRELGDQRDKEDEERTRKLEEEILQGRKERQARRAERARSISPVKDTTSNAGTPHSMRSTMDASMQDLTSSPSNFQIATPSHQQHVQEDSMADDTTSKTTQPGRVSGNKAASDHPSTSSTSSPTSVMPLSRSNTLSWQQRPSSRGTTAAKSRPLSMLALGNHAARSPLAISESTPVREEPTSRSTIAQSLEAKDPAFFRQTEDRGLGSAANRKTQTDSDMPSASGAMRLPGLSNESSLEPDRASMSPPPNAQRLSPSNEGSARGGLGSAPVLSASNSNGSIRSPLPTMSSQRFEPPTSDSSSSYGTESISTGRTLAMSPSQGRMIGERLDRPASPTKGLGGFVQSAMLKRSDSVNKRWSAQVGPGLSRGNSIASNRSGYGGSKSTMGNIGPPEDFRPTSTSRETSPTSDSRPGSGHRNILALQRSETSESPSMEGLKISTAANDGVAVTPPTLSQDASSFVELGGIGTREDTERSAPSSPTKKWSPSKSSWLENAINKPDSPKPKIGPPQQPGWMVGLNKAKQQPGGVDHGKVGNFKEVSTGGFMRSPPPGGFGKSPSISGFSNPFSASVVEKHEAQSHPESVQIKSFQDTAVILKEPIAQTKIESLKNGSPSQPGKDDRPHPDPATISKSILEKPPPPKKVLANGGDSPSAKSKPETPPKKDFTSSLKPRKVSAENITENEPEFKNVFGKLKKTQTQNYVAPDELKNNILRGKAGLAFTGGPKKTDHKDEFKDSILRKKEAMKVGFPPISAATTNPLKAQDSMVPEALAKRAGLGRTKSSAEKTEYSEVKLPQTKLNSHPVKSAFLDKPMAGSTFNASLAGILSRGPRTTNPEPNAGISQIPSAATEGIISSAMDPGSSKAPQLSHMTKGRARGPKRRLPTTIDQPAAASPAPCSPNVSDILVDESLRKDVSHDQNTISPPLPEDPRPLANISNNNRKVSQATPPRKPSSSIASFKDAKPQSPPQKTSVKEASAGPGRTSPGLKQKPTSAPTTEKTRKPSLSVGPALISRTINSPEPQKPSRSANPPTTERQLPSSKPNEEVKPPNSVKSAAAIWQHSTPIQRSVAKSPIKLPTRKDEEAAHERAGLRSPSPTIPIGLGIETSLSKPQTPIASTRSLPTPPALSPKSPKSPPIPGKKPLSISDRKFSNNLSTHVLPQNNGSPTSEAARTISEFFGESTKSSEKLNLDTQGVIASCSSRNGPEKIKTLRKQIFEVAGDGKLHPVPSHQEHILFEENLYICTHVFGGLSGTRTTEVYLWYGDCVPISALEDAQLFARKVAKDNNGRLIILRQGKETSNFFQALGGIVITRRGSNSRGGSPLDSSASYMLCARRHVGQIAFDEVDFSPATLCRGFPHIVSTPPNKLYLWKGSGSGADELGCARLIGMDLGLTGEIEEIDEGQEPASFWQCFPKSRTIQDSQYWHLKSTCEQYTTRMFSIDTEFSRPKSSSSYLSWGRRGSAPTTDDNCALTVVIKEIMPFAQADMAEDGVYVLDAFFEIFVLVTAKSTTLLSSFRAALIFAQEYGILIASAEDRPFVPNSSVVLGRDAPVGMKRAFRKWEERRGPCVVVGLEEALRATQGS